MIRRYEIQSNERAILYRHGAFVEYLRPGVHWRWDPAMSLELLRVKLEPVVVELPELEAIVDSGQLGTDAVVIDLAGTERALVWRDGRLVAILGPGLHLAWNVPRPVTVDRVDARKVRLEDDRLSVIAEHPSAAVKLSLFTIPAGQVGLPYVDGRLTETLGPGRYAFWRGVGDLRVVQVDLRESTLDISGQDIMTQDRVSLRLNALVSYRVTDAVTAVEKVGDYTQAIYRLAQLALREIVGGRTLDAILAEKDGVARALSEALAGPMAELGVQVTRTGIRDVILPGEMRTLLNRVSEAKAAAEASLITRREETAAMRSQANTAKVLDSNPTLMRLRELEVVEKVIERANLQVVLGESGLTDRLTKMI